MKAKQIGAIALIAIFLFGTVYIGCSGDKKQPKPNPKTTTEKKEITAPVFQADSAYVYIEKQVAFGPRVPGTSAHKACGDWMVAKLKSYGAAVTEQTTTLKKFDGSTIPVRNIIASFGSEKSNRVMLCAHWDSRPFGDKDKDTNLWKKPIDGANDGGSGVGVLLEIGRQLSTSPTQVGIDLVFFDAEDLGTAEFADGSNDVLNEGFTTSWCLGSQHWAKKKHADNYNARFGILLDMVGAENATFNKEKFSMMNSGDVVNLIWSTATKLGYSSVFNNDEIEGVTDDHVFVSKGGIRCVDIIDTKPQVMAMGLGGYVFGSYHHTHNDNMSIIDKSTLTAVGQTVMQVIYNQ
ncbi:MAG: M28 family peptidase [Flavobacteriales bacterium]